MTPQRSQRIEQRLHDLGIVYNANAEVFDSCDGLVEVEAILAAMPDCCVNDLADFVERKRMVHYHTAIANSQRFRKPRVSRELSHTSA